MGRSPFASLRARQPISGQTTPVRCTSVRHTRAGDLPETSGASKLNRTNMFYGDLSEISDEDLRNVRAPAAIHRTVRRLTLPHRKWSGPCLLPSRPHRAQIDEATMRNLVWVPMKVRPKHHALLRCVRLQSVHATVCCSPDKRPPHTSSLPRLQEGDVVLVDNYQVMHGRAKFSGERLHAVTWFQ